MNKTRWTAAAVAAAALLGLAAGGAAASTPATGTEGVVAVGSGSVATAVSPDGTRAYAVAQQSGGGVALSVVDTGTDAVVGRVDLGTDSWITYLALSADGSRLYALHGHTLSVVDTAAPALLGSYALPDQPRPTGWTPGGTEGLALSTDGSTLYLAQDGPETYRQYGQGRVLTFDTGSRTFTGAVQLAATELGALAVRPGGHDLYAGTVAGVVHLSTATAVPTVVGTVPGTETANYYQLAFAPNGSKLFAVNGTVNGKGAVIDPGTDTVTKNLALPASDLRAPRVSADGTKLYIADNDLNNGGEVLVYNTTTGAALTRQTIATDQDSLTGLALGPDGHTAYLGGTAGSTGNLQIIDY
ncbi:WD40 repeat domain-containing protein [Kitasatospora sp. NPDC058965]|uniref:WD40 repeat domain-containing protein n=1 Tax=Kitasatospora sp. NPDC058965 TaxID=3346682 RepID=UPI0036A4C428